MPTFDGDWVIGGDASSSGAKILAMDLSGNVLAIGRAKYGYIKGLPEGQCRLDQEVMIGGLREAAADLHRQIQLDPAKCRGIALGGAMHGLNVLAADGSTLGPTICWDDAGDEEHGMRATEKLGVPIARRFSLARYCGWKARRESASADRAASVLTPASYATFRGCGARVVLPGDASGMTGYLEDPTKFDINALSTVDVQFPSLLPRIVPFGEKVGITSTEGAKIFGVPEGTPWAGPCGDQPLGSYGKGCSRAGDISIELGSSIVGNVFGRKVIRNKRGLVEALRSSLGDDMMMCCITNGVQAYQALFEFFRPLFGGNDAELHDKLAALAASTPPGAGGLMALPFLKAEGALLREHASGAIFGMSDQNFKIGNVVRSFMETPILILRRALREMGALDAKARIVLSGGGANSTIWPQIVADVLGAPVTVSACTEAVAFGAALNALAMAKRERGESVSAQELADSCCRYDKTFAPNEAAAGVYAKLEDEVFAAEKAIDELAA